VYQSAYLQNEFHCKDACENEVEVVEDIIAEGAFSNWIFCSQCDATGADDDHDEQIEEAQVDHKVAELADAAKK
jgi:hypothetical protein